MVNFVQKNNRRRAHHWFWPCEANQHKPHFVRHKALHFYAGLLIAVKVMVLVFVFSMYPSEAQFSTVTSNRIIDLTNQERQEAGLSPLRTNSILNQSALLKARDMVNEDYFAHDSPDGVEPWEWFKKAGYNYTYAGENLAMNFSEAEEAIEAWMDSPTHKANMVNGNYDEIGVAVIVGNIDGRETTIVVQHFGKSFVTPVSEEFARNVGEGAPGIAGVTMVGGGEATEVAFREASEKGVVSKVVYYSRKFFMVLGIFVLINLLLTIFVRVKIQHKPVILHALLVVIIAGAMWLAKLHFVENIVGESVKVL